MDTCYLFSEDQIIFHIDNIFHVVTTIFFVLANHLMKTELCYNSTSTSISIIKGKVLPLCYTTNNIF
jgi:hypothetical protein